VRIQKNRGIVRHGDFYPAAWQLFVNSGAVAISPSSERFFMEILKTDVVQKEFKV
jgi:hypothetical protein